MLSVKQFDVDRYTYNGTSIVGPPNRETKEFQTNNIRLAYAVARTICSYHVTQRELYFDTISSLLGLLCMVEPSRNFRISADRIKRLRDFSRTNRIGELAQGVSYLYTQHRLNFPYIVDYHLFCELKSIPTTGVTPDFVVLNNSKQVGLMEAKGVGPKSKTTPVTNLNRAMRQINGAEGTLNTNSIGVNRKFPISTKFKSGKKQISVISYCDISTAKSPAPTKPNDIFMLSYSSWFYLVGDFTRAATLSRFENIVDLRDDPEYEYDKERDVYWRKSLESNIFSGRVMIDFHLMFHHHEGLRFGIKKNIIDELVSTNLEGDLPNNDDYATNNDNYQWFKDGTVIQINRF